MVVDNPSAATPASASDDLFRALADPTRRDILGRCGSSASSISQLASGYPMSFAAVQKHVAVLEQAGLVNKRKSGREQLVSSNPEGIASARAALDQLEATWHGRVRRMGSVLAEDSGPNTPKPPTERTEQ